MENTNETKTKRGYRSQPLPTGYMKSAQVCAELGISNTTLFRWINLGYLTPFHITGWQSNLFRVEEVATLKANR